MLASAELLYIVFYKSKIVCLCGLHKHGIVCFDKRGIVGFVLAPQVQNCNVISLGTELRVCNLHNLRNCVSGSCKHRLSATDFRYIAINLVRLYNYIVIFMYCNAVSELFVLCGFFCKCGKVYLPRACNCVCSAGMEL